MLPLVPRGMDAHAATPGPRWPEEPLAQLSWSELSLNGPSGSSANFTSVSALVTSFLRMIHRGGHERGTPGDHHGARQASALEEGRAHDEVLGHLFEDVGFERGEGVDLLCRDLGVREIERLILVLHQLEKLALVLQ